MNYKQLYYFWSVAKYGGITRASEQLHLTPQTISGQISELESKLGTQLFDRVGRRLKLTPTGEIAFSHADEIFEIGKELEALIQGRQEESDLIFRVGVSDVIPKSIAYRLLAPSIEIEEPVKLVCVESKLELLFADLAIHKIDMIISDRPLPSNLGLKGFSHFLGESKMAFYAEKKLAKKIKANLPDSLNGAPLLLPGSESAMRVSIDRWLAKHKLKPHIKGEFDDTALMKTFAEEGLGLFPAPEVIADEVLRNHGVELIYTIDDMSCRYYAISVQRKLSHPAIVAISESAQNSLFN
jgi:LysR family transcriptional activator of nhaA